MALVQKPFGDIISFTRASSATRINASGVLETVASNVPRIDYDPVTLECKGLLIEEQRTNLFVNSDDLTQGSWVKGNLSATQDKLTRLTAASANCARGFAASIGSTLTMTVYAKAAMTGNRLGMRMLGTYPNRADGVFDLSDGQLVGASGTAFTGIAADISGPDLAGWYRCRLTATIAGSDMVAAQFGPTDSTRGIGDWEGASAVLSDVYIKGLQLEAGSFPTSYIPTSVSQVTRAADVASINTLSPWYNQSEGTLFAEFVGGRESNQNGYGRVLGYDGSRAMLSLKGPTGVHVQTWNGVSSIDSAAVPSAYVNTTKAAMAYTQNERVITANGLPVTSGSGIGVTPTSFQLGANVSGVNPLNGHIRKLRYYPKRLDNAALQALTA